MTIQSHKRRHTTGFTDSVWVPHDKYTDMYVYDLQCNFTAWISGNKAVSTGAYTVGTVEDYEDCGEKKGIIIGYFKGKQWQ